MEQKEQQTRVKQIVWFFVGLESTYHVEQQKPPVVLLA